MREGSLGFRRCWSRPLKGAIDRRTADPEELSQLGLGVGAEIVELQKVLGLVRLQFRLLPFERPFALAIFMPSRVPIRIRSDSNSATIANTLLVKKRNAAVGVIASITSVSGTNAVCADRDRRDDLALRPQERRRRITGRLMPVINHVGAAIDKSENARRPGRGAPGRSTRGQPD